MEGPSPAMPSDDRTGLIERHLGWARKQTVRYRGYGVSDEDLVSTAYLALTEAAGEYDLVVHQISFASYAWKLIKRRILEALETAPIIRMPRRLERAAAKCRAAAAALFAAGEPRPTMDALARAAGLDEETCREAVELTELSIPVEDVGVLDEIPDPDQQRLLDLVDEVLDRCTSLGRTILLLVRVEGLSQGQIARRLGQPLGVVRKEHREACLTVAGEMQRRGWSETSWRAAIA